MSTILEALRRVEKEKRQQPEAPLESRIVEPALPDRAWSVTVLPWGIAAFSIVVLLVLGLTFLGSSVSPAPSRIEADSGERPPVRFEEEIAVRTPPREPLDSPQVGIPQAKMRPTPSVSDSQPVLNPASVSPSNQSTPEGSLARNRVPVPPAPSPRRVALADPQPVRALAPPVVAKAPVALPTPPAAPEPPVRSTPAAPPPVVVGPAKVSKRSPPMTVLKTIWHPRPERRVARLEVKEGDGVLEVREGDQIEGFEVQEIRLSGVVLVRDGVISERRVGSRP